MTLLRPITLSLLSCFLLCAFHTDNHTSLSESFSSGNLGKPNLAKVINNQANIQLRNDNHNSDLDSLPLWRNWWYVKLNNLDTQTDFMFVINDVFSKENPGWTNKYTPVYSYDQVHWQRLEENQVTATTTDMTDNQQQQQIAIDSTFTQSSVFLARFYPYTQEDFNRFYQTLKSEYPDKFDQGFIQRETLGNSAVHHFPIDMLTITDPNVKSGKKRIWIQARSHPAETGGSFVVEGIINWLLNDSSADTDYVLSHFIINIVPIHNPEGVYDGNYRTNSLSQNLESAWKRSSTNPARLTDDSPIENQILSHEMFKLSQSDSPFIMALNLHSTQSDPDRQAFFFPHFGPESRGYNRNEAQLWNNTIRFIDGVRDHYKNEQGEPLIENTPDQGGRSFVDKSYPESWWWANFGSNVMAVTMETTYEKAGYQQGFVTPDRLRNLGAALMKSLDEYTQPNAELKANTYTTEPALHSQLEPNRPTEEQTKN